MKTSQMRAGAYIAVGIGIGTSLGVAISNPAAGVALGLVLGSFLSIAGLARRDLVTSHKTLK